MTNYGALSAVAMLLLAGVAAEAETENGAPLYRQLPGGRLTFTFVQAGAAAEGEFGSFSTQLRFDPGHPADARLDVTVQVSSLDTRDKDRDATLAGADFFDATDLPTARFVATQFQPAAAGRYDVAGKLTLRGVTRDLTIPLTVRATGGGRLEISGEVALQRLDFGIGRGEWQSTEWVGNEVRVRYKVPLGPANGDAGK
jgi:polyisoprenoid-binding protein YceI